MSNKKQAAVEWLQEQLECFGDNQELQMPWTTLDELFEQAKEMEKQQITQGFKNGLEYWNGDEWKLIDIEQYYKETYGE
jgi:hypothetical protein